MGGAAGEAFVADIEKIGTFGDLFGGPTKVDREQDPTKRGDALRKLLNRVRFSSRKVYCLHHLFTVLVKVLKN